MSTITDTLRDIGINNGFMVCGEAADEIEALEKSYELLFTENAKLRAEQAEHRPSYAEAFDAIERGAAILTRACDDALDRLAALPQSAALPTESQILQAAEEAGLWPNTVSSWIPEFIRYHVVMNRLLSEALTKGAKP